MREVVYYVASSIDGFIAGADGDISMFGAAGSGVDRYLADLKAFDTVVMGRGTYEFGYRFGLEPGMPAYEGMEHHIFSSSLSFAQQDGSVHVEPVDLGRIEALKGQDGGAIYLCGGGVFAGWLLDAGQIDVLKLKLNPILLGSGTRLFGSSSTVAQADLLSRESHDGGLELLTYRLRS